MLKSMTGFTSRIMESNKKFPFQSLNIVLRGVNARFFDLTIRLPEELFFLEDSIRKLFVGRVYRGKIEARIYLGDVSVSQEKNISFEALAELRKISDQAYEYFPNARHLSLQEILNWPGVLTTKKSSCIASEHLADSILAFVRDAISDFVVSRVHEGERLFKQLHGLLKALRHEITYLKTQWPILTMEYRSRIKTKLHDIASMSCEFDAFFKKERDKKLPYDTRMNAKSGVDQVDFFHRLEQEIHFYILRADISEELVRLESHVEEAIAVLKNSGPVGKRLDFLAQEMNREVNTIASKSSNIHVNKASLACKLAIEQFREQVQNIE